MKEKIYQTKKCNTYSVVLVFSTGHAIRAEKLLKNSGITCKLVPVPRHLSSDCGVSVRIKQNDKEGVLKVFKINNYDFDTIYDV